MKTTIDISKRTNWPDAVRLEMTEHSKMYDNPRDYQYGFYDGYQKLKDNHDKLIEALKECIHDIDVYHGNVPRGSYDCNGYAKAKQLLNQLNESK